MDAAEKSPAQLLATPLQFVKGVGPERAELLEKLGLRTVRDVLFNFPRDYQDLSQLRAIHELQDGETVSVRGTVEEWDQHVGGSGTHILGVLLRETNPSAAKPPTIKPGCLRGLWFNQAYLRNQFRVGQHVVFSGRAKRTGLVWEMSHPRVQWLGEDEQPNSGVLPIYSLCEGLKQHHLRRISENVLQQFVEVLEEAFPADFLTQHDLWPLHQTLRQIHFPATPGDLEKARRRLVFQELLILQLALSLKRRARDRQPAAPLEATARIDARIRRLFPFELTAGQQQAIAEVSADLARPSPMHRLLQGDVGSGKTMVAVYAMLLAVAHGQQAVLMAPTEILARQHAQTLGQLLSAARARVGLLVGGLTSSERSPLVAQIAAGEIDIVIGTQAVLQADVEFAKLGLVVIDEQHKFGVRQRALLKQAAQAPHYLVMTATPIPRTVSLTLYGDLEVSVIRDHPPGRQPVKTYLAGSERRAQWWEFLRKKLREGRQAYVIAPVVEESETFNVASVQQTFEALANGELEAFRLGLLHGRMSAADKDAAMQAFRDGQTQVLVATTVVEVGVDVPNATLMTIEGGERFGLSQLHQLRGRIGRGAFPGFCCLFAEPASDESRQRLEAFVNTTDGFELAETDFRLRGPGDLFGTRQHGMPPLMIADLQRDTALLDETRHAAAALLDADAELGQPQHQRLRKLVYTRYGSVLELADVG